jgi:hypothetical protein
MEKQTTTDTPITEKEPQVPNPPTPPEKKAPKKKKTKTWIIVSVTILLLAILVAAGIILAKSGQIKKLLNPAAKPQPSPGVSLPTPLVTPETALPSPIASPSPNAEISNYLSFSKNNICYTFKYPKEITLKEQGDVINLSLWGPTQKKDTELFDGISLSFSLPLNLGNKSLEDYVDSAIEESKQHGQILVPKQSITVNGINGYTYTSEGLAVFKSIYLQSPNKTCAVEITDATKDPTNKGFAKTVDQILSTFEFTN